LAIAGGLKQTAGGALPTGGGGCPGPVDDTRIGDAAGGDSCAGEVEMRIGAGVAAEAEA
jgi:hypothetical protein